ncbi:M48 family metalloprotease [Acidobacteriota bacterium]
MKYKIPALAMALAMFEARMRFKSAFNHEKSFADREIFLYYTYKIGSTMKKAFADDFYEIQHKQKTKSLFVFFILILFYFFSVGFIFLIFFLFLGFFLTKFSIFSGDTLFKLLFLNLNTSIIIASFHFYDAKKFGARFIRKRLAAKSPDLSDRYHKQFINTLEEMRIASGLPSINPYIIPEFAINSMALIEADNTPSVIVTEGLLADFTRDELQAVIAHELAHIIRGDTFYITLVCSLANFFERLRQALEPEGPPQAYPSQTGAGPPIVYTALTLSTIIMHLLSTLVSRQREILADATAVELSRNPRALARAIYKAQLKNSFVGDFNLTYSPLFIVHPESKGESKGFFAKLFNSHPPLVQRIRLLASMVQAKPEEITEEVLEIQENREQARSILHSREESPRQSISEAISDKPPQQEGKIWSIRDSRGKLQGPFTLEELLFLQYFTPLIRVKNIQEGVEAIAKEFPQIRNSLRNLGKKIPVDPAKKNQCPRCRHSLRDTFYEGTALKACPECRGKLVDAAFVPRIISRREVTFSEHLNKKAQEFKQAFMFNPALAKRLRTVKSPSIFCPSCGTKMCPRPYSYYYVIPVEKCFSCQKIWFDPDELETLQILIESKKRD